MPITADVWETALNDNEYQEGFGLGGSLYEVGIYHGKYFSILVRSAARTGSSIIGLDIFHYIGESDFHANFDEKFGPAVLNKAKPFHSNIMRESSGALSPNQLLKALGTEARFISIDGSHEYDDVLWDLFRATNTLEQRA
jgi:hypothetical protein